MPRTQRLIINDESTVYHVMSRTALDGFPLGDLGIMYRPTTGTTFYLLISA